MQPQALKICTQSSWAYPCFAAIFLWLWIRILHDENDPKYTIAETSFRLAVAFLLKFCFQGWNLVRFREDYVETKVVISN